MLLINRTTPTLSIEEHDLSSHTPIPPRTTRRPTDQWSGELKSPALDAFRRPTIETEDEDIEFAPVPEDSPPAGSPHTTPPPSLRTTPQGDSMFIQQLQGGTCHLRLNLSDLALFALVLRHATENVHLLRLNPLMPSALESLATAFESATVLALHQTGQVHLDANTPLTAEAVQAWCQRVVVEGLSKTATPVYRAEDATSAPARESQHPFGREDT
jgi:hypothetical protein